MKKILISTLSVIFLVGCGGGSGGDSDSPPPSTDIIMVPSESYTVYSGNQIVKTSEDALIRITHTDEHNESTVQLVEGNATILRNQ